MLYWYFFGKRMSDITITPENYIQQTNPQNEDNKFDKADVILTIEPKETHSEEQYKNIDTNLEVTKFDTNDEEKGIIKPSKGHSVSKNLGGSHNPAKIPSTWVQCSVNRSRIPPPPEGVPLDYDPYIRNSFVRLVFGIVLAMLLVTAIFTFFVHVTPELRDIFQRHGFMIVIIGMVLMLSLSYAITCSPCTRKVPCNFICLVLAVIGMSLICAFVTIHYRTELILYAVLATIAVVITCLLLACSNFDFTKYMLYVIVVSVAFSAIVLMVSLTMLLTGKHMPMLHLAILIVGTLINVVVLTIELQTILGGKAIEMSEDDYALAAFLLYTSIVDIFLKILQIMGLVNDM